VTAFSCATVHKTCFRLRSSGWSGSLSAYPHKLVIIRARHFLSPVHIANFGSPIQSVCFCWNMYSVWANSSTHKSQAKNQ
jgi:hypothetical protein